MPAAGPPAADPHSRHGRSRCRWHIFASLAVYHALTFVSFCRAEQLGLRPVITPRCFGAVPHLAVQGVEEEGDAGNEGWDADLVGGGAGGKGGGVETAASRQMSRRGVGWEQGRANAGGADADATTGAGAPGARSLSQSKLPSQLSLGGRSDGGQTSGGASVGPPQGRRDSYGLNLGISRLGHHAQSNETNVGALGEKAPSHPLNPAAVAPSPCHWRGASLPSAPGRACAVRVSTKEQVGRLVGTTQAVVEGHRIGAHAPGPLPASLRPAPGRTGPRRPP